MHMRSDANVPDGEGLGRREPSSAAEVASGLGRHGDDRVGLDLSRQRRREDSRRSLARRGALIQEACAGTAAERKRRHETFSGSVERRDDDLGEVARRVGRRRDANEGRTFDLGDLDSSESA